MPTSSAAPPADGMLHITLVRASLPPTTSSAPPHLEFKLDLPGQAAASDSPWCALIAPGGGSSAEPPIKKQALPLHKASSPRAGGSPPPPARQLSVRAKAEGDQYASFTGAAVLSSFSPDCAYHSTMRIPMLDFAAQAIVGEIEVLLEYAPLVVVGGVGGGGGGQAPPVTAAPTPTPTPATRPTPPRSLRLRQLQSRFTFLNKQNLLQWAMSTNWVMALLACTPYLLFTLLTPLGWAFRQWLLVVPLYVYCALHMPTWLGWALGEAITTFALYGYPGRFVCEALHVSLWINNRALHFHLALERTALGNPPGYAFKNFFSVGKLDVAGYVTLQDVRDAVFRRYKAVSLESVKDFVYLAKIQLAHIDVDELFLDIHLHDGVLNINKINSLLADLECKSIAVSKGYMKDTDPMPNQLEIHIIRAVDLAFTKSPAKSSLSAKSGGASKQQQQQVAEEDSQWGKIAMVDAFLELEPSADGDASTAAMLTTAAGTGSEEAARAEEWASGTGKRSAQDKHDANYSPRITFAPNVDVNVDKDVAGGGGGGGGDPERGGGGGDKYNDKVKEEEDEDEEASARRSSVDDQAKHYRGLGPPAFNPMDGTVEVVVNSQTAFDPYVVVTLRRDVQSTKTQASTNSPMFNETLYFTVTDSSTVVLVQVFNRQPTGSTLLGQWYMTLKYLLSNPFNCIHDEDTFRVAAMEDNTRRIQGWFPLINDKLRGKGLCGKLEMALQWTYVPPRSLQHNVPPPPALSALGQLQENSKELTLRIGDFARTKFWLQREAVLLDVDRMALRNLRVYLNDLFVAKNAQGLADTAGDLDALPFVKIQQIDWVEQLKPKKRGEPGITVYDLLMHVVWGIIPKVLNLAKSKANVGSTLASIVGMAGPKISHDLAAGVKHMSRGEPFGPFRVINRGARKLAKSLATSLQVTQRRTMQNARDEQNYRALVDASDEDFMLDASKVVVAGRLARCAVALEGSEVEPGGDSSSSSSGGSGTALCITQAALVDEVRDTMRAFLTYQFELKGRTLFYREEKTAAAAVKAGGGEEVADEGGSIYNLTYKIPLAEISVAVHFEQFGEMLLVHNTTPTTTNNNGSDKTTTTTANNNTQVVVTRLRLPPPAEPSTELVSWLAALQAAGVPCSRL